MDIGYLLTLQAFRGSTGDALTPLMEAVSFFVVSLLIMIPVFIYWAVDKRRGLFALVSYALCAAATTLVKLTACVIRPWLRDPRVVPAGKAIDTATGYSFPSGHTAAAGAIYGALAVSAWKRRRWAAVLCLAVLLLTAFSRNYLGVHTPQDVAAALGLAALALLAVTGIFRYLVKHPEKENLLLLLAFLAGWAGIAYITLKPYPVPGAEGALPVDPREMMTDGYGDLCLLVALPPARWLEKTRVRFRPTGLRGRGLALTLLGLVPMAGIYLGLRHPLDALLGPHWGRFCLTFLMVFFAVALWPMVIRRVTGETEEDSQQATD